MWNGESIPQTEQEALEKLEYLLYFLESNTGVILKHIH